MISINNEASTQQLAETPTYYDRKEYDEPLKVEMIPLQVTTNQNDSTMVTITPDQPPIRDHIVWSLINTFYMNFCCLGLIAFLFSIKSRDQKLIGNQDEARRYGATSRSLNIASSVLYTLCFIISACIVYYNFLYLIATIKSWLRL